MSLPPTTPAAVSHLHHEGSFNIAEHPLPTGKEEAWRFTPLDRLADCFHRACVSGGLVTQITAGDQEFERLSFGRSPRGDVLTPLDRPAALAAAVRQARYLCLEGELAAPVELTVEGEDASRLTADHLVIEAKPGAQATVIITHQGPARHLGNVEILVGAGAQLTVVSIQDWAPGSVHLGQHEALVGPDAHYRHIAVSLGGAVVRLQNKVSYAASGGLAQLFGVYFAQAGQHLEHRLFVDHNQPKGRSLVDYRGALQGEKARSVWIGDVLIQPTALGIETYESSRNLLLTKGCRADAVPNLEIETGEILGAGHSASTGWFDEEQLFYLRSRGIPEAEARQLVVRGFFAAILAQIGLDTVSEALLTRIDYALNFPKEN